MRDDIVIESLSTVRYNTFGKKKLDCTIHVEKEPRFSHERNSRSEHSPTRQIDAGAVETTPTIVRLGQEQVPR
jgi:hypothetical protein